MRDYDLLGIDPKTAHTIRDDSLDRAIEENDAEDLDREDIHYALKEVQKEMEAEYLNDWLYYSREVCGVMERIHKDNNAWTFANYEQTGWEEVFETADVDDPVLQSVIEDAHLFESQMFDTEREGTDDDLTDQSSWDTFIVGKSPRWREGEEDIKKYFIWLIQNGISPAKAIDYWMCEIIGESQKDWAINRGVSRSTVNENVAEAREKIELLEEEDDDHVEIKKLHDCQGWGWKWAEQHICDQLTYLAHEGCSPAEMMDYWVCEMQMGKQSVWTAVRAVDQSTVSGNLNDARDKINNEYYDTPSRSEVYEEMEEHYDA